MPAANYAVADTGGDTPKITAEKREEIIVRNAGTGTVTLTFNETAVAGTGFYLLAGDFVVLTGRRASSAIHAICESGQSATLKCDILN